MRHFVWILAFFTCYVGAVERSLFNNPDISTDTLLFYKKRMHVMILYYLL